MHVIDLFSVVVKICKMLNLIEVDLKHSMFLHRSNNDRVKNCLSFLIYVFLDIWILHANYKTIINNIKTNKLIIFCFNVKREKSPLRSMIFNNRLGYDFYIPLGLWNTGHRGLIKGIAKKNQGSIYPRS